MSTPIATVEPHGTGWGIVVSDFLIYLPERTVAVAVASVINGTCAGTARQRDELRAERDELRTMLTWLLDAYNTGGIAAWLVAADAARAALERIEEAQP